MKIFCIGPAYSLNEAMDLYEKGKFAGHLLYGVNKMNKYGQEVLLPKHQRKNYLINRLLNKKGIKSFFGDIYDQIEAYKRKGEYNVLYACWADHIFLICILKYLKLYNKPIVALTHSIKNVENYNFIKGVIQKLRYKIIYKSIDYNIAISNIGYENLKKYYGKYIKGLKYIPLAPESIDYEHSGINQSRVIVSAGKTYRDYETLIKAVKDINCKCIIFSGKGLDQYVNKYNNIKIINRYVDFDKVLDEYKKARAIVIPMRETGYGMYGYSSILDSLALNKPMIITKTVGIGIQVQELNCGIEVKERDIIQLREAILKIIDDDEFYANQVKSIKNIMKKFNIEEFTRQVVEIINYVYENVK